MSTNRTLSGLPTADDLSNDDLILVTQNGLSKKATVGDVTTGVLGNVVFQQEATENEAVAGVTSDTVMSARRVKGALDDFKRYILPAEGREYLGAFHNALIAKVNPTTVLISGDSTTRGHGGTLKYMDPQYVPQTILGNLARGTGVEGVYCLGLGRSGATSGDWLNTGLLEEDMSYSPTLYIWHWGLNDPVVHVQNLTPEETRDNLRVGLELIREDHPRDEMSIVILTPNMSDTANVGRTPEWFDAVIPYMREAARDFECAFIDIYTPWKNADGTMMYTEGSGQFLHPGNGYSLQSWSMIADAVLPLGLRKPVPTKPVDLFKQKRVKAGTWLSSDPGANNQWRGVIWAPEFGLFVAVGSSGTGNRVTTSPDGVNWTTRTPAADDSWRAVCYSPELRRVVAVANAGAGTRAMTSDDGGITWTARTPATSSDAWSGVCWSPDRRLFVAVGVSGVLMTSPDGITWTARTAAATNNWQSVCWSRFHGLFVAVAATGTGNRVMTSHDGISWTARTSPSNIQWNSVTVSERLGRFVAVANASGGNNAMTSEDGFTWTLGAGQANAMPAVACNEEIGLFAAVSSAGTGNRVAHSSDGLTWTNGVSAADQNWQGVCAAPELGLFCAVAFDGTGNGVMTSVSAHSFAYRS